MTINELAYEIAGIGNHEEAETLKQRWLQNPNFALAFGLVCEGFSVIPLCRDGKRPTRKWKPFQYRKPSLTELVEWFFYNDFCPAIVTGEVSGITVIDCDSKEAIDACIDSGIESHISQATRRGRHFVFRYGGERNTVRVDGMAGVDRRGEGGYVKAYPDSGSWTSESILTAPSLR